MDAPEVTLPAYLTRVFACLLALTLAACITREPTPADIQAKRFEPVPDKAVVYLYRDRLDFVDSAPAVMLDGQLQGATYRGTYFRFVVAPGRHLLEGYAADNGRYQFNTEAGRIYFIRQTVSRLAGFDLSFFQPVPPGYGRAAVLQYELN